MSYFLVCLLWGSSNLATKIGTGSLPPGAFLALRFLITALIATLFSACTHAKFPTDRRTIGQLTVRAVLLNVLTSGLLVLAMRFIDSSVATLIFSLIPIIVTLIDCFVLKNHRLQLPGLIGLLGGLAGIAMIVLSGASSLRTNLLGILLMLLASIAWSIGTIYCRRTIDGSPFAQLAIQTGVASAICAVLALCTGQFRHVTLSVGALLPVFYLAFFDSFVGLSAYIYLVGVWPPMRVSTYAYVNTVVAFILGALILHEPVTPLRVAAVVMIIASVVFIQLERVPKSSRRERTHPR